MWKNARSILFFCTLFACSGVYGDTSSWKLLENQDGLKIYQREVSDSPIVAFKGEGVLDAPLDRVAGVMLDHARAKEWVDRLEDVHRIRMLGPEEYVEYSHIGTPFVMKDRDFVIHTQLKLHPETGTFIIDSHSVVDPDVPENSKRIRGEIIHAQFTLTALEHGTKTLIVAELHADPKGGVPKWIVNLFQRSWPRHAFRGLQKQLAKDDITLPEKFRDLFQRVALMLKGAHVEAVQLESGTGNKP